VEIEVADPQAGRLPESHAGVRDQEDEQVERRSALRRQLVDLGVGQEALPASPRVRS